MIDLLRIYICCYLDRFQFHQYQSRYLNYLTTQGLSCYFLLKEIDLKSIIIGFISFSHTSKNFEFFHSDYKSLIFYQSTYNFKAFFDGVIYNFENFLFLSHLTFY
jgi:hypothetical protein